MELQSGDVLLFRGSSFFSTILEYIGQSKYSHVGIILKNPSFLNESLEDGLYVLESSWGCGPDSEDHLNKYGVQIHKLKDIIKLYPPKSIYVRRINQQRDDTFHEKMKKIHTIVHNKPYDTHLFDWIMAKDNMTNPVPINYIWKNTSRFWCSALVSYIFLKLGWISDVNWTLVSPREFSSKDSTGQLLFTCIIQDEELLIE